MTRLTPQGVVILLVAAATYAGARATGTWELYVLAVALVVLVAAAWLQVRITRRRVHVTRTIAPRRPVAGDPVSFSFAIDNRSPFPGQGIAVEDACRPFADDDAPIPVTDARRRSRQVVTAGPWPAQRGVHHLPPFVAAVEDTLGLARARTPQDPLDFVVPPRLVHLDSCWLTADAGIGSDSRRRRPTPLGYEFHGLRPYAPGEPLNRVDWKATAKTSILMLRETEDAADSDVTVLLNGVAGQTAGHAPASNFEVAVQVAGSILDHALRMARPATLLVPERDWVALRLPPGTNGRVALLEALAAARPDGLPRLGPRLRQLVTAGRVLQRGSLLVLVVLALDEDLTHELIALRAGGLRIAVVHVPPAPFRTWSEGRAARGSVAPRDDPRDASLDAALRSVASPHDTRDAALATATGSALEATLRAAGVGCRTLGPDDDLRSALTLLPGPRLGSARQRVASRTGATA